MKKILIINGQPKRSGLSFFISNNYLKGIRKENAIVRKIDISKIEFSPVYEGYSDKRPLEEGIKKAQKLILWADHIVFVYPMWWGSMPALLKGFIDKTIAPGFAFSYTKGGKVNKKLKGKTARIIVTSGSPKLYKPGVYLLIGTSLKYPVLKFLGFKKIKTNIFPESRNNLKKEYLDYIGKKSLGFGKTDSK